MQPTPTFSPHEVANAVAALAGIWAMFLLFVLVIVIATIFAHWRIAAKAGYPGVYSLFLLIPMANLILLFVFAFAEWPIERQLRALGGGALPPPPPGPGPAPTWQPPMTT